MSQPMKPSTLRFGSPDLSSGQSSGPGATGSSTAGQPQILTAGQPQVERMGLPFNPQKSAGQPQTVAGPPRAEQGQPSALSAYAAAYRDKGLLVLTEKIRAFGVSETDQVFTDMMLSDFRHRVLPVLARMPVPVLRALLEGRMPEASQTEAYRQYASLAAIGCPLIYYRCMVDKDGLRFTTNELLVVLDCADVYLNQHDEATVSVAYTIDCYCAPWERSQTDRGERKYLAGDNARAMQNAKLKSIRDFLQRTPDDQRGKRRTDMLSYIGCATGDKYATCVEEHESHSDPRELGHLLEAVAGAVFPARGFKFSTYIVGYITDPDQADVAQASFALMTGSYVKYGLGVKDQAADELLPPTVSEEVWDSWCRAMLNQSPFSDNIEREKNRSRENRKANAETRWLIEESKRLAAELQPILDRVMAQSRQEPQPESPSEPWSAYS